MYNNMREEYQIKTGKKHAQHQSMQMKTGVHLMTDDEIIQKIKDSYNGVKEPPKKITKNEPWITYEYNHPGQWVIFAYFFNFFIERISN